MEFQGGGVTLIGTLWQAGLQQDVKRLTDLKPNRPETVPVLITRLAQFIHRYGVIHKSVCILLTGTVDIVKLLSIENPRKTVNTTLSRKNFQEPKLPNQHVKMARRDHALAFPLALSKYLLQKHNKAK